mgnify:CR=1 FL=1
MTPWGTWLTCEETLVQPGDLDDDKPIDLDQEHGWIFEVHPDGKQEAVPLKAMGRMVHEAIAIDRETGIVYETEDRGAAGFYRFIPNQPGRLAEGGKLEMLKAVEHPNLSGRVKNGAKFDVEWVPIENPTWAHTPGSQDSSGLFNQGLAQGGTTFSRLEGCWAGDDRIFFDSTSGGLEHAGQIWAFDPKNQTLEMLYESPGAEVLNMPDNLCVSPKGGLLLCEDSDYGKFAQQRVHLLDQSGQLSLFAVNSVQLNGEHNGIKGDFRGREWAGASFSPDGQWLFINIQTPGITFAITGPWDDVL